VTTLSRGTGLTWRPPYKSHKRLQFSRNRYSSEDHAECDWKQRHNGERPNSAKAGSVINELIPATKKVSGINAGVRFDIPLRFIAPASRDLSRRRRTALQQDYGVFVQWQM
jgi:hypothetical protein